MKKLSYVASLKSRAKGFKMEEAELISYILIDNPGPQTIASKLGKDPEHAALDRKMVMAELRGRIREELVQRAEPVLQAA